MTIKPNILHHYVDLLRISDGEERIPEQSETCVTALHNVIRTMRLSRHDKICGENFSRLDFGNIPFNGVHWSLNGELPSRFDGCRLNEWNYVCGHSSPIKAVDWSFDGKVILTGSEDGTFILWKADTGLMNQLIRLKIFKNDYSTVVYALFLSIDKNILIGSNSGDSEILNYETGESLKISETDYKLIVSIADSYKRRFGTKFTTDKNVIQTLKRLHPYIKSVAYSPNRKFILTNGFLPKIWDCTSYKCLHTLYGHSKEVSSIGFSPDGKRCVTGSDDYTAKIWDCETGNCLKTLGGHFFPITSIAISIDGRYCLIGSEDSTAKILDFKTGKVSKTLKGHFDSITAVSISFDSKYCLTGSKDTAARIWDFKTGKCLKILCDYSDNITTVAFSAKGNYYFIGSQSSFDCNYTAKIWNKNTWKCINLAEGYVDDTTSAAFSSDEKYCITGSRDNTIKIWDIETGKCLKTLTEHEASITAVVFSLDGELCMTGSKDHTANIWNCKSGICLKTLKGHSEAITYVNFTSDGKYCFTGSKDFTAKIWDCKTGKCLNTFTFPKTKNAEIKWQFPFFAIIQKNICTIYKYEDDFFNEKPIPTFIGSFYNVNDLHIKDCPFRNITANSPTRKILYQYGGITDPDSE